MSDTTYQDRQEFEMGHWPELRETWNQMIQLVFPEREVSGELKQLVFTVASLASGCRHCQSHGAYHLHKIGVSDEKIQALWSFETSDLFTDAERAPQAGDGGRCRAEHDRAREFRRDAAAFHQYPDHRDPRGDCGWRLSEPLERHHRDGHRPGIHRFRRSGAAAGGLGSGKHVGASEEQRKAHPITLGWSKK